MSSAQWPALVEVEPARPADAHRPASSAVFKPAYAKDGAPSLGYTTLLEMFECVGTYNPPLAWS